MLARNSYPKDHVDAVQTRIDAQVEAFRALTASAALADVEAFEPSFFNDLVIVLHASFEHRTRAIEGKDGNPLNEVRVLANSIMVHDGVLTSDPAIRLDPAKSVLGIEPGAQIVLSADDVRRLCEAFFAEIEARFG